MRILFDQGTPVPLRRALMGHDVATAHELGWASLSNGDLLQEAEGKFNLLITTDQNLQYQQSVAGKQLAILVLPTTNWRQLLPHAQQIATEAIAMNPGECLEFRLPV